MLDVVIEKEIKRARANISLFDISLSKEKADEFSQNLFIAMNHEIIVNNWFDAGFQKKLRTLFEELALNAYRYGEAKNCDFILYRNKVVIEDDGNKFNLATDSPTQESYGYGVGAEILKNFMEKYWLQAEYKYFYDVERERNVVTINILNSQNFSLSVNSNCELITSGCFPFLSRTERLKLDPIPIPEYCEEVVFEIDDYALSTGFMETIVAIRREALPRRVKMIAVINKTNDHINYLIKSLKSLGIIININD